MKTGVFFLFGIFTVISFSSCANSKNIQEKAPVDLEQAYYTTWVGGTKGAGSGLNFYIPMIQTQDIDIEMDSVYFRGKRAELQFKPENENLYIGYFRTGENSNKAPDVIMSSDPTEEYGNQLPQMTEDFPFDLEENEAVLSFRKNGKRGYYKMDVVERKQDRDVIIKNYPENIQH
ncbi:hypothetical protein GCM10007103_20750 [Salinimicrobium marinum]|uniref:Lipoprotein n=1 Tax=Salinimicrobium marinum TaxID=680283 RepID=A0A918SFH9_9FLAO|nr:hypothetical protein [Salinimicrobium marinum]GHA39155.1 hypothetical protein GCM10007103_20750 [Salinimicrobium marinum]